MAGTLVVAFSSPGEHDWKDGVRHFSADDFHQTQEAFERAVEQEAEGWTFSLWLALAIGQRAERITGFQKPSVAPLVRRMRREMECSIGLDETNLDA